MRATPRVRGLVGVGLATWALALAGCREANMVEQPKVIPLRPSPFFPNGTSARPVEPGTVARGQLRLHPAFDAGEVEGKLVAYVPLKGFDPNDPNKPADDATARGERRRALERGRERYNIYCAPCHDRTGSGNGIIVQRGFSRPPSLHEERLRQAPPGHLFKVITNGYGAMYSYASRIAPADRWAIITYIRALQASQAPVDPAAGKLAANDAGTDAGTGTGNSTTTTTAAAGRAPQEGQAR